jgi:phenylpyruvate tautomerase PptA (4-oxalocrotonate tautomerase family)
LAKEEEGEMPCLYVRNLPKEGVAWDPVACWHLFRDIAEAAGVNLEEDPDAVRIHLENTRYQSLRMDGTVSPDPRVEVFVLWFEGRSDEVKERVAGIVNRFLVSHAGIDESEIAYFDFPPGSFFHNGKRVE